MPRDTVTDILCSPLYALTVLPLRALSFSLLSLSLCAPLLTLLSTLSLYALSILYAVFSGHLGTQPPARIDGELSPRPGTRNLGTWPPTEIDCNDSPNPYNTGKPKTGTREPGNPTARRKRRKLMENPGIQPPAEIGKVFPPILSISNWTPSVQALTGELLRGPLQCKH